MKRRWWFLGLFAPQVVGQGVRSGVCQGKPVPRCEKPANNECPVCGTMAEPYKQPFTTSIAIEVDYEAGKKWDEENPGKKRHWVATKPPKKYPVGDPFRIARCTHCNAAFWQDAV